MNQFEKAETFARELSWIKDEGIREFITICVKNLPDYFFTVAASSSGRFHPKYALGDGGLVRHTRAAVTFAKELLYLDMYSKFNNREKDLIIGALILHDGYKHGVEDEQTTIFRHPVLCAEEISKVNYVEYMSKIEFIQLTECISSHMGQWNFYRGVEETLPKPNKPMQKFVHQCDYLASRKEFDIDFDAVNIRE